MLSVIDLYASKPTAGNIKGASYYKRSVAGYLYFTFIPQAIFYSLMILKMGINIARNMSR
jgi:hypothetical protein